MNTPVFALLAILATVISADLQENDEDISFIKGNFNWQKHVRSLTNSSIHSLNKRGIKNKAKYQKSHVHPKLLLANGIYHRVKRSLLDTPHRRFHISTDGQIRQARNVDPQYGEIHQNVYTHPFVYHHRYGKYFKTVPRVRREKLLKLLKMMEMNGRLKRNILSKSQSDGCTTSCSPPKTKSPTTKCTTTSTCKTTTTKCTTPTTLKPCISTKKCSVTSHSDKIDSSIGSNFKRQSPFKFHQKKKRAFKRKPYLFRRSRLNKEMLESLLETL